MHLNERGQKVESVQRMTATGKEPASPGAAQARVLPAHAIPRPDAVFAKRGLDKNARSAQPVYEATSCMMFARESDRLPKK